MNHKTYTFDEAFKASLNYFAGDELAAKVWVNKYALKDAFGNIYEKSPIDMHHRLANEIARIEKKYPNPLSEEELFSLFDHFRYIIPQGSPMTGIGNDYQIASLSNCFVIGLDGDADSYGAIIRIDEEQVQLMKRRGGVGHDLSHIRPKGSPVKNSALTSTGLVPFMERYSNSTREVAQDGRRGALMLSVSIKHPDSESFIDAKMTEGKVTGANVSVKIDDEFIRGKILNASPSVYFGKQIQHNTASKKNERTYLNIHNTVGYHSLHYASEVSERRNSKHCTACGNCNKPEHRPRDKEMLHPSSAHRNENGNSGKYYLKRSTVHKGHFRKKNQCSVKSRDKSTDKQTQGSNLLSAHHRCDEYDNRIHK